MGVAGRGSRRLGGGLALLLALAATWLASGASETVPEARAAGGLDWPDLHLETVVTGLSGALQVTNAGDDSGRLFIVEQGGRIRVYEHGVLLPAPLLDVSALITAGGERGLLGLAFSPDFASDGDFYVNYTDLSGDTRIVRYHVPDGTPNQADPSSAELVLRVAQDFSNHNGGQLVFGPDGMLYIGMGDGGSAGDPNNRAQDSSVLLGKILRIDVETGDPLTYTIPADNPFVGNPDVRDEIWALGLRNPWRFSFDRATGDLWIGDVGQNNWEEIDFQPASSSGGENYGWRCYEGNHPFQLTGCAPSTAYDFPVWEYSHNEGGFQCSVTGGFVYRGGEFPRMVGVYFYADYCSGNLWGLQPDGSSWQNQLLIDMTGNPRGFGEDEAGNLYVTTAGNLYRLTDPTGPTPTPAASTATPAAPTATPAPPTPTASSGTPIPTATAPAGTPEPTATPTREPRAYLPIFYVDWTAD